MSFPALKAMLERAPIHPVHLSVHTPVLSKPLCPRKRLRQLHPHTGTEMSHWPPFLLPQALSQASSKVSAARTTARGHCPSLRCSQAPGFQIPDVTWNSGVAGLQPAYGSRSPARDMLILQPRWSQGRAGRKAHLCEEDTREGRGDRQTGREGGQRPPEAVLGSVKEPVLTWCLKRRALVPAPHCPSPDITPGHLHPMCHRLLRL